MSVKIAALFLFISIVTIASKKHRLVAYWGQNGVYHQTKKLPYFERDLNYMCEQTKYDIIALAFLNIFFDDQNEERMPALNFAYHCTRPSDRRYPTLLQCPLVEEAIEKCQKNGKEVILSLGGEIGSYGFSSTEDAKLFAYRLWHLFLGGEELKDIRPFGKAVLDGLDINAINNTHIGYSDFVQEIRRLEGETMDNKTNKTTNMTTFDLAATTQCQFPDRILGPDAGYVLGDMPSAFNFIFVQFRSVWCTSEDLDFVLSHLREWFKFSEEKDSGLIFLGLPAGIGAAGDAGCYRTPEELRVIYDNIKNEPRFGGIMLWDVGFDRASRDDGKKFSDHVYDMLNNIPIPTLFPRPTMINTLPDEKVCSDRAQNCDRMTHLCNRPDFYGEYMKFACRRTCRNCDPKHSMTACRDYTGRCIGWKNSGLCDKMDFMGVVCRRSCNLCGGFDTLMYFIYKRAR